MRTPTALLFGLSALASCGGEPDPCGPMCATAAELYGGCLTDQGADWTAAGYDDAADFVASCETWAWTTRELEADADREGATDQACRDRQAVLETGTCDDFLDMDWSDVPW